jgi:hypothetical protein
MLVAAHSLQAVGTHFNGGYYYGVSVVLALVFAFVCAAIAGRKGRSRLLWGVLGFLFHIITLIVIALLPSKRAPLRY